MSWSRRGYTRWDWRPWDEDTSAHVWQIGHVFHVHLHVFPQLRGDGCHIGAEWATRPRPLLDQEAEAVRRAVATSQ